MKKKTLRILTVLFIVSIMLVAFSTVIRAEGDGTDATTGLSTSGLLDQVKDKSQNAGTQQSAQIGGLIVGIVQTVGTIVAVVVVVILGIKYMTGSTEEKAEYKKTMLPYFVGAIVLFLGVTIVRVIFSFATRVNNGVDADGLQ